jgi:hypothetical protein
MEKNGEDICYFLLGYDAQYSGRLSTFRRRLLPLSSGYNDELIMEKNGKDSL